MADNAPNFIRRSGFISSVKADDQTIDKALANLGVLALLGEPVLPQHRSISVLVSDQNQVATVKNGELAPGLDLSDLVYKLATELEADVLIGPARYDASAGSDEDYEPDYAALRVAVLTPMSPYTVPLQSTLLERTLAVVNLPEIDRRLVLYAGDGLEIGDLGWDEEQLPSLVLRSYKGELSLAAITSGDLDDDSEVVTVLRRREWMVWPKGRISKDRKDELTAALAAPTHAAELSLVTPNADVEALDKALAADSGNGVDGTGPVLEALGLPQWLGPWLRGEIATSAVEDVVVHEPRGLSNAVGRSVSMMLDDSAVSGPSFWQGYTRTVTDQPWLFRAAHLLEAGAGGALVGTALTRRLRKGGGLSGTLLVMGAGLVVDSAAEFALASWTRARELRRRAVVAEREARRAAAAQ